ncbi:hypothetical protein [Streptomyces roseochromogenus]|uniref:SnoaL-like domain-containing protein n=1 Tax=Streptomyces roseochromogenus subsp. oscitans DS 12.976 TaxID=1352936 RepID=V6KY96_STRRC|nr:hypothetical protein [Streptomyces roseochromogenus]EST36411.1 hypothetical protein M878_02180 [Streptomyces roseochromogenus subsp. oscitans DS 12.976]
MRSLLWVGGIIGGVGFGASFSGTFRAVAPLAQSHERAALFASIHVVAYPSFGVPTIIAGLLIAPIGLLHTVLGYGVAIRSLPGELRHLCELITAEGGMAMVRGRFSGHGQPVPWIAADFLRLEDGVMVDHWDAIEDEASREQSVSGLPMYGDDFPERR